MTQKGNMKRIYSCIWCRERKNRSDNRTVLINKLREELSNLPADNRVTKDVLGDESSSSSEDLFSLFRD